MEIPTLNSEQQTEKNKLDSARAKARQHQSRPLPAGGINVPTMGKNNLSQANKPENQGILSPEQEWRRLAENRNKSAKNKEKQDKETKNKAEKKRRDAYPIPIPFLDFLIFGAVALLGDIITLILDLIGIGIIAGWIQSFLMWPFYYWMIVRRAPKDLAPGLFRGPLWKRSALSGVFELLPVVGQVWFGWTVTAVMSYLMIHRWEEGKSK